MWNVKLGLTDVWQLGVRHEWRGVDWAESFHIFQALPASLSGCKLTILLSSKTSKIQKYRIGDCPPVLPSPVPRCLQVHQPPQPPHRPRWWSPGAELCPGWWVFPLICCFDWRSNCILTESDRETRDCVTGWHNFWCHTIHAQPADETYKGFKSVIIFVCFQKPVCKDAIKGSLYVWLEFIWQLFCLRCLFDLFFARFEHQTYHFKQLVWRKV